MLYSPSAPRRCAPATCTRPSAASRSASLLAHGHQANATGGSSRAAGPRAAAAPDRSPATTSVGRGGPIGRTERRRRCRPARRRRRRPARQGTRRGWRWRRTAAARQRVPHRGERDPGARPPSGASGRAVTSGAGLPGPNSSSTVMPSAWARASATRSDGSDRPDSTADTAWRDTRPSRPAAAGDRPRAWRASRSRASPPAPLVGHRVRTCSASAAPGGATGRPGCPGGADRRTPSGPKQGGSSAVTTSCVAAPRGGVGQPAGDPVAANGQVGLPARARPGGTR